MKICDVCTNTSCVSELCFPNKHFCASQTDFSVWGLGTEAQRHEGTECVNEERQCQGERTAALIPHTPSPPQPLPPNTHTYTHLLPTHPSGLSLGVFAACSCCHGNFVCISQWSSRPSAGIQAFETVSQVSPHEKTAVYSGWLAASNVTDAFPTEQKGGEKERKKKTWPRIRLWLTNATVFTSRLIRASEVQNQEETKSVSQNPKGMEINFRTWINHRFSYCH